MGNMKRPGRNVWSDNEINYLKKCIKKNVHIDDIIKQMDRGEHGVRSKYYNLKREIKKEKNSNYPAKFNTSWTHKEKEKLEDLIKQGLSDNQISTLLERTSYGVRNKREQLRRKELEKNNIQSHTNQDPKILNSQQLNGKMTLQVVVPSNDNQIIKDLINKYGAEKVQVSA